MILYIENWCILHIIQCLKLNVAQLPMGIKNWAGPVKFDPGQVKIIIDLYKEGKYFNIS